MILGKHLQDILVHDGPNWKVCGIYFCNTVKKPCREMSILEITTKSKSFIEKFLFWNTAKNPCREISILEHTAKTPCREISILEHTAKKPCREISILGHTAKKPCREIFFPLNNNI